MAGGKKYLKGFQCSVQGEPHRQPAIYAGLLTPTRGVLQPCHRTLMKQPG